MRTRSVRPSPRHVGEIDRLRAVGEDQARAVFLVARLEHALCRAEAVFGQRRMPGQKTSSSVMSTSAWPSPVRSTNADWDRAMSTVQAATMKARKGSQPSSPSCARRNPVLDRRARRDRVDRRRQDPAAVPRPPQIAACWLCAQRVPAARTSHVHVSAVLLLEIDRAEIALVEPAVGLFGENPDSLRRRDRSIDTSRRRVRRAGSPGFRHRHREPFHRRPAWCIRTRAAAAISSDSGVYCAWIGCALSRCVAAMRNGHHASDDRVLLVFDESVERTSWSSLPSSSANR